METVNETLGLLKRQAELENAMNLPCGIRITEEQELHLANGYLNSPKPCRQSFKPRTPCAALSRVDSD
jgi:hypothetical protein